jgi:rSAM/selenodomain-associated transferase 1
MRASHVNPNQTSIAIFAKAPIEGFTNTRLIPRLGAAGAAELQKTLITRAVEIAKAAKLGPVSLWCAPDCTHPFFQEVARQHSITLHAQIGDDLGARMQNAFAALCGSMPVLLMGTDCVVIDTPLLSRCAKALQTGKAAVFLPVEDGGYILVGLNKPIPELFHDMPWTSERVMPETRRRANKIGLRFEEPKMLWDIDLPEDYERALAAGFL